LNKKENLYQSAFEKITQVCQKNLIAEKWRRILSRYLLPSKNFSEGNQIEYVTTLGLHDVEPN